MATLVVGAAAQTIGPASIALGVLAAYFDQKHLYPALFGKNDPRPTSLEGFQISTTNPGSPRWEIYGTRAWVPCHYLWSLNIRDEIDQNSVGGGKGGESKQFIHTVRADVGLGVADGPITGIETMFAGEDPFWAKNFNLALIEDYRWTLEDSSGDLLITCVSVDQQDFASLFEPDDLVRLEGASPSSLNGFYRVVTVARHTGSNPGSITLQPDEGQVPATGTAGSPIAPAILRRIDYGYEHVFTWTPNPNPVSPVVSSIGIDVTGHIVTLVTYGTDPDDEIFAEERWPVGGKYRLINWTVAGQGNGVWTLTYYQRRWFASTLPLGTIWRFEQEPNGNPVTQAGCNFTVANPLIFFRDATIERFVNYDSQQDSREYAGTNDQVQDPSLAALEPDAPAHRGIAHLSISDWNLGAHYNIFPEVTAQARSRTGETAAEAIKRICGRTMTPEQSDVAGLRPRALLGYSVPGGLPGLPALQPLLTFFGVAVQDRGGVLTFLDERDLPVVAVSTRHLNARPANAQRDSRGFTANRVDPTDIPERVLIHYREPSEGKYESEGDGFRVPGAQNRGRGDTLDLDLKPLVAWPYDVKRRAREIRRRIQLETYRGQVALPPGYMDVLPGTILTFASNNDQEEDLPAGATIAYDTELRDIVPGSVALQVRFTNGQVATLLDDENGALEGLPAGITASVNAIDYEAGRIELTCSVDLDDTLVPALTYRYEKQWFMRASKALLSGFDFSLQCDVVTTSTDDPLPPLPREIPGGLGGALAGATPVYETEVIDVPPLYVGQNSNVLIYFGITPTPGSVWRGATIYQSPNGTDRWSAVSQAGSPTPMGTVPVATLSDSASANPAVIDWTTEVTVDLASGETLESATTEQIALGQNWALIGDEIVGFHEAEAQAGTEWVLRGLVRALRHTHAAIDTHADGERFVLLTGIGGLHGAVFEPVGGYAAANRTYYFRVVPAGASVDSVETISQLIVGRSALVAPPLLEASMITQSVGSHLDITWERRSYGQTTLFGALPLPPGEFERYEVVAFDHAEYLAEVGDIGVDAAIAAAARRRWIVGDQSMGTPLVDRAVVYTNAEMEGPDGFVLGTDAIGFVVYQMGAAGRSERSGIVVMTPTATPVEV